MRGDERLHVSISIGVAPFEREARELMHSLAAAETACKAAKDRGRNRVAVYEPNDQSIVRRFTDINIASRVREAIEAQPGVTRLSHNARTGTLLVEYQLGLAEPDDLLQHIADAAGHSSSTVTREVYRHQISDKVARAAEAMDRIFGAGGAS